MYWTAYELHTTPSTGLEINGGCYGALWGSRCTTHRHDIKDRIEGVVIHHIQGIHTKNLLFFSLISLSPLLIFFFAIFTN